MRQMGNLPGASGFYLCCGHQLSSWLLLLCPVASLLLLPLEKGRSGVLHAQLPPHLETAPHRERLSVLALACTPCVLACS